MNHVSDVLSIGLCGIYLKNDIWYICKTTPQVLQNIDNISTYRCNKNVQIIKILCNLSTRVWVLINMVSYFEFTICKYPQIYHKFNKYIEL